MYIVIEDEAVAGRLHIMYVRINIVYEGNDVRTIIF